MRNIVACNDLLKFASLRAEPDYRYVAATFACIHGRVDTTW